MHNTSRHRFKAKPSPPRYLKASLRGKARHVWTVPGIRYTLRQPLRDTPRHPLHPRPAPPRYPEASLQGKARHVWTGPGIRYTLGQPRHDTPKHPCGVRRGTSGWCQASSTPSAKPNQIPRRDFRSVKKWTCRIVRRPVTCSSSSCTKTRRGGNVKGFGAKGHHSPQRRR